MLDNKTSLNKFKTIEIISSTFSNYNGMKLEINHKKKMEKKTQIWRLSNVLLNNQQFIKGIKGKIRNLETKENINSTYQNLWDVSCIQPGLVICFTLDNIRFDAVLLKHPTLAFSHRV